MHLTIINGSPRGIHGNSEIIARWFLESLSEKMSVHLFHAAKIHDHEKIVSQIRDDQMILVVFPLYIDSVPYVLKALLEKLSTRKRALRNVSIYYVVQCGFPGGNHCRAVEKYLEYFSSYMGFNDMGTAIRPALEGLRLRPESKRKDLRQIFLSLANDIEAGLPFNMEDLKQLIPYEKPPVEITSNKHFNYGGPYFDRLLKENNSFEKRFNQPYR